MRQRYEKGLEKEDMMTDKVRILEKGGLFFNVSKKYCIFGSII
jgi:hypothetical protein